jgi:hypothetical protein
MAWSADNFWNFRLRRHRIARKFISFKFKIIDRNIHKSLYMKLLDNQFNHKKERILDMAYENRNLK